MKRFKIIVDGRMVKMIDSASASIAYMYARANYATETSDDVMVVEDVELTLDPDFIKNHFSFSHVSG